MSTAASLQTLTAKPKVLNYSGHAGLLLQHKCACRSPTRSLTGACGECRSGKRLQTKVAIGASNDPLELEADRVADQVLAAPANPAVNGAPLRIQRFGGQPSASTGAAPASVDRVLGGPGRPLDPALQRDMEPRFGHDFSRVRVHSDAIAEQSAQEVRAQAYTVGQDIVFGTGRFAPKTHEGRRLIAHELTHVVQQSGGAAAIQRAPATDMRWSRDVSAARYRGRLIAKRISIHTKLSKEARAKINSELAYFEGAAKEAYLKEVRPALLAVTEIEMPAEQVIPRGPRPIESMLTLDDSGLCGGLKCATDAEVYGPLIEAERKEAEEKKKELDQYVEAVNNRSEWIIKGGSCRTSHGRHMWRQMQAYYRDAVNPNFPGGDVPGAAFFKSQIFQDWCFGGFLTILNQFEKDPIGTYNQLQWLTIWLTEEGMKRAQLVSFLASALIPGIGSLRPQTRPAPATMAPPTRRFSNSNASSASTDVELPTAAKTTVGTTAPKPRGTNPGGSVPGMPPEQPTMAPARPPARTIKASPPPVRTSTTRGPAPVTDAEVMASNVRDPSSIKPQDPNRHQAKWQELGGSEAETAPLAYRDPDGNIRVSTDHKLLAPARRVGIPPVSPGAPTPVAPTARPAPNPAPAPAKRDIGTADTGQAPAVSSATPDPLAKTPAAPAPAIPARQPSTPNLKPGPQTGLGSEQSKQPMAPPPRGGSRWNPKDPPQAISPDVVQRLGPRARFTVDHARHQQAWNLLGGQGTAPPAFFSEGIGYLDPSRWPPKTK